jgi:hypothetical protein
MGEDYNTSNISFKGREKRLNKKEHKPAEDDGTKNHDDKQGYGISNLSLSLVSSDKRQDDTDEECIQDHR